jgi:Tol biopolymer transport system component
MTTSPLTSILKISNGINNTQGDNGSGEFGEIAISRDGLRVVFGSRASNLVANDPNGGGFSGRDVFLYNRDANTVTRIAAGVTPDISDNGRYITYDDKRLDLDTNTTITFARGLNGAALTGPFGAASNGGRISRDGRYIAFYSHANNLVADDTNNNSDIFLFDAVDNTTIKISTGTGFSTRPEISDDGSLIVYAQNENSVYLYNRLTGANTKISPDNYPTANIERPVISADNRYIYYNAYRYDTTTSTNSAYTTPVPILSSDGGYEVLTANDQSNLVPGDNNGFTDVFIRPANTAGTTVDNTPSVPPLTGIRRITLTPDKQQSNNDSESIYITMSSDGRYVLYGSKASNLVAGDTNGKSDLFLYDRITDTNTRIGDGVTTDSSPTGGSTGLPFSTPSPVSNGALVNATISSNGRYVVYRTSSGLAVYDTTTKTTTAAGTNQSGYATISDDGNLIAFQSDASSIVSGDTNGKKDIFLFNRTTNVITKLPNSFGSADFPVISPDGSFVVYSIVDELSILSSNPNNGLYIYDVAAATSTKAPDSDTGILGLGLGYAHISADSRYITYRGGANASETKKFDRTTNAVTAGNVELLNIGSAGLLSDDGNYRVILAPDSINLVPGDTNGFKDLFIQAVNGGTGGTGSTAGGTIPGLKVVSNLFQTDNTFKGLSIAPLSQKTNQTVSEIALFAVDDLAGTIGSLAPGQAGYLAAALQNAKTVFSTLGGSFFSTDKRELSLDPNKIYQAIQVTDGSIAEAQFNLAQGKTPTNILFSTPNASSSSGLTVATKANDGGYQISVNVPIQDALVLDLAPITGAVANLPIGAKSQSAAEGRLIDLTDYAGQTLKVDLAAKSSAFYENQIGFYAVEDALGSIKLANGTTLKPGDANYAQEAVKMALTNSIQANKNDTLTGRDLAGGKIYAPVAISQGSLSSFLNNNPTNGGGADVVHAYFNYIGANPDKVDHFRLLGNNTFGVEDIYGGGDRDFNDIVVKMNFQALPAG